MKGKVNVQKTQSETNMLSYLITQRQARMLVIKMQMHNGDKIKTKQCFTWQILNEWCCSNSELAIVLQLILNL